MAIKELFQDSRPQVLFDPRASQRIDPRFKFTRNSIGTYIDRDRRVITAPANQPRLNFDANSGEPLGFLVEQSRTNRVTYSEDFSLGWQNTSSATVITPNAVAGPFTGTLATKLTATARYSQLRIASLANTLECLSVYIKPINCNLLGIGSLAFSTWGAASFNFGTQTFFGVSSALDSYGAESLPNGWWRIWASGIISTANTLYIRNEDDISYASPVDSFYVWGAQLENGLTPSSYIPTAGSAVTRAADLLSIEGTSLPSTGSIYIDARSLTSNINDTLLSAANASNDKLTLAIRQPANLYNSKALVYEVDGAFKPTLPFPVPGVTRERNLITYGANNYHYRQDSARYTPSSSTSVPAGMTRLGIGHDVTDPTKAITGYINTVYLWPGEITPTVAEALVRGDLDPKNADSGVFTPETGALAFVFNTQGTATDGNRVVQLPLRGSTNNVLVDWGDNTSSSLIGAAASVTVNHTYPAAGIYPVQITADSDGTNSGLQNLEFYNNSPADLVRVLQWGGTTTWKPTTMYRVFRDCVQLNFENAARTNLPNTSAITNWQEAFYNCNSISGTFPTFNTSAATNFSSTWFGCSSLTSFPFISSSNVTNFNNAWNNCSGLTSFPLIDTAAGTTFSGTWFGCSGLTAFPLIDTGSATSFFQAWRGCSALVSFPNIDLSLAGTLQQAWNGCSSLTSFPLLNTATVTVFDSAWSGCTSLTSFPLINTAAGTDFDSAWFYCQSLTSFPLIDTGAGTTFNNAWFGCNSLTSFPNIDTSTATSLQQTWYECSSLSAFPALDTSSCTTFYHAWRSCSSLTSFPVIDTSAATNVSRAWYACTALTAFPTLDFDAVTGLASDASNVYTGFYGTWNVCTALTTFPANLFNNTTCTRYLDAFKNCALTAASIENIIVSIEAAGTSNGNLSLEGGTNAGASTWTANAVTAYNALVARGWTITRNA